MAARHLVFIRHGESEHHVRGLTGGWTDTPLTPLGRAQVRATADYLLANRPASVVLFASDLKRADESARIIGERLGCEPTSLASLRELDNGDARDLTLEDAALIAAPGPPARDPDWQPYPGAETWRRLFERMQHALTTMEQVLNDGDTLVVVGHGLSGQALVLAWLGLDPATNIALHFDVASVTELKINEWGEREITQLNRTFHGTS